MNKKVLLIIIAVIVALVGYNKCKKPKTSPNIVMGYEGIVSDVENGNTLVLTSGLKVYLLGIDEGHETTEVWLKNNVKGKKVKLVSDSGNEKSFTKVGDTVKAYALIEKNGVWHCVNRMCVDDNRTCYTQAYMKDSSFVKPNVPVEVKDKALYMRQRSMVVSAGNSIGTAFFINKNGLAITNNHVLDGSEPSCIYFYSKHDAEDSNLNPANRRRIKDILWTNPNLDVTVFKVELENDEFVDYFDLIDRHEPVGNDCHIIGNPDAHFGNYNKGTISGYGDDDVVGVKGRKLVRYDASTNGGNSGGPLMNDYGQVLGVVTLSQQRLGDGRMAKGLNYAVDIQHVRNILDELKVDYGGK